MRGEEEARSESRLSYRSLQESRDGLEVFKHHKGGGGEKGGEKDLGEKEGLEEDTRQPGSCGGYDGQLHPDPYPSCLLSLKHFLQHASSARRKLKIRGHLPCKYCDLKHDCC